MNPVLAGCEEHVKLVEALAQVACKFFCEIILIIIQCLVNVKCEVKNNRPELLPILGQPTEMIVAGFRTLLRALRHLFNEKNTSLPVGQLHVNRQQYERELQERHNIRLLL
jgi:uncharacterized Fe-S cluster-containing radical SAM superfamily protein